MRSIFYFAIGVFFFFSFLWLPPLVGFLGAVINRPRYVIRVLRLNVLDWMRRALH